MLPQDWQPMIHGVFVDAQQPACGPDTHAFRQGRCPAHVCGGIRADARISRAGARRHQPGAALTAKTRGIPMPTPETSTGRMGHTAIQGTLRIPAVTCLAIHLGRPSAKLICGEFCLVDQFELENDLYPL
jgi:hypothetical protein